MKTREDVYVLEKLLIPKERWREAPERIRNKCQKCSEDGIPSGLAFKDGVWYLLHTGQGPYIGAIESQ